MPPTFSLIVPTRKHRPLRAFLDSVAATAARPNRIEVVLVVDDDDPGSLTDHQRLSIRHVIVPPGQTMGALNTAGYEASVGDYVMLLNDDVVIRTRGWDRTALNCFNRFPDPYVLVHVNDTLMRHHLCTFPLLSRKYCEEIGGICPREYVRYRIDDHIEDPFNLLAAVGVRRTVYLPDVIFEHANAVVHPSAGRVYESDPAILAIDAPLFDSLFSARKALALRLLEKIGGVTESSRRQLAAITDPFALRTIGRQIVQRAPLWRRALRQARPRNLASHAHQLVVRARTCVRKKGYKGLIRSLFAKLQRVDSIPESA